MSDDTMALLTETERPFAVAVSRLLRCNPFTPKRIELEQQALGDSFAAGAPVWHAGSDREPNANARMLNERAESLVEGLRERLASGAAARPDEIALYENLIVYTLYTRYQEQLGELVRHPAATTSRIELYTRFCGDRAHYHSVTSPSPDRLPTPHLFAICFQVRRAFHFTFRNIIGGSMAAARLRSVVWQSIFTHDMDRYSRSLYRDMENITTLISGPSGTGKELVARAIGSSRYLPFDERRQAFVSDFSASFYALSLSALPSTLVESELFGHKRGAFTGAVADRVGWLEACPPLGTVFLDEIGEIDVPIQAKLLRVLETRAFQRLGETSDRHFGGKLIAATNRDLAAEMGSHRFREDLYYRLCSDLIHTPALRDQLRGSPEELRALLMFIARRVGHDPEAEKLADEAERWIVKHLGLDYAWPGNFRELEQCVRNVMLRGEYVPAALTARSLRERLISSLIDGSLTADELLCAYCTLLYASTGSYQETARRLGLDRRTVKDKIDATLLARLEASDAP